MVSILVRANEAKNHRISMDSNLQHWTSIHVVPFTFIVTLLIIMIFNVIIVMRLEFM